MSHALEQLQKVSLSKGRPGIRAGRKGACGLPSQSRDLPSVVPPVTNGIGYGSKDQAKPYQICSHVYDLEIEDGTTCPK